MHFLRKVRRESLRDTFPHTEGYSTCWGQSRGCPVFFKRRSRERLMRAPSVQSLHKWPTWEAPWNERLQTHTQKDVLAKIQMGGPTDWPEPSKRDQIWKGPRGQSDPDWTTQTQTERIGCELTSSYVRSWLLGTKWTCEDLCHSQTHTRCVLLSGSSPQSRCDRSFTRPVRCARWLTGHRLHINQPIISPGQQHLPRQPGPLIQSPWGSGSGGALIG